MTLCSNGQRDSELPHLSLHFSKNCITSYFLNFYIFMLIFRLSNVTKAENITNLIQTSQCIKNID